MKLKRLHDEVKHISSNCEVEMKRDMYTHDMFFTFEYNKTKWEIAFPKNFPLGYLKLKEATTVGDRIPNTIRKQEIRKILDEMEDVVRNRKSVAKKVETKDDQWYASCEGQENLQRLYDGVKNISSNYEVEMIRDTFTHDVFFTFADYYGTKWEIAYPHDFPAGYLKF